jgi:hypothetical protein
MIKKGRQNMMRVAVAEIAEIFAIGLFVAGVSVMGAAFRFVV